ncbi:outer membrane beta-barrel protein [Calditrichota bacterium GD2]
MRVLKILLILLTASGVTFAQEQNFQFPKYALQFGVVDLLSFSPYYGNLISFKYHFNNHYALRVGLSGVNQDTESDTKKYLTYSERPDSITTDTNVDVTTRQYGINLLLLKYFKPDKPIKFYVGAGPTISYAASESVTKEKKSYLSGTSSEERTTLSMGLRAVYGVEWFFHSQMSLNMDYGMDFYYERIDTKRQRDYYAPGEKTDYVRTSWTFSPVSLRLGLTVYF